MRRPWFEPAVLVFYRCRAARWEDSRMSEQTTCRKTYKEKLRPTPAQARALAAVLWRCRTLSNTALEQRIAAWERCHICLTRSQQEAELKDIRAECPDSAALHSHVLQDVLARLDKTYQAFFRRLAAGEKPGFPRLQGKDRYHSFTYNEVGNGARLDNGALVLSTIGRIAVRWSRPVQGTIKTVTVSREADGWYVCCSCAGVPTQPLPLSGHETGIDVGLKVFLITAEGEPTSPPKGNRLRTLATPARLSGRSRKRSSGSPAARRGASGAEKPWRCVRRSISMCADSAAISTIRRRSRWCVPTTRSPSRPSKPPT